MAQKKTKSRRPMPRNKPAIARKPVGRRPVARRPTPKKAAPRRAAHPSSWLDENDQKPVIERYARKLSSFIDAMADGKVDEGEIRAQEARLARLMREVEPQLDGAMHAKITQLLCELTAYDLMHVLHSMQMARPEGAAQAWRP
jgi:hypothetical protein